jgi:hypothetical protein
VLDAIHSVRQAKVVRRSIHLTLFGEDFCRVCLTSDGRVGDGFPAHAVPRRPARAPRRPARAPQPPAEPGGRLTARGARAAGLSRFRDGDGLLGLGTVCDGGRTPQEDNRERDRDQDQRRGDCERQVIAAHQRGVQ